MKLMEEVDKRLKATEELLTSLVKRLDDLRSVEEEQADAGRAVRDVAAQTREAVEALSSAAKSLHEASETFRASDPGELHKSMKDLKGGVDDLAKQGRADAEAAKERFDSQAETASSLGKSIETLHDSVNGLASQVQANAEAAKARFAAQAAELRALQDTIHASFWSKIKRFFGKSGKRWRES